jgi:hypothetical protein
MRRMCGIWVLFFCIGGVVCVRGDTPEVDEQELVVEGDPDSDVAPKTVEVVAAQEEKTDESEESAQEHVEPETVEKSEDISESTTDEPTEDTEVTPEPVEEPEVISEPGAVLPGPVESGSDIDKAVAGEIEDRSETDVFTPVVTIPEPPSDVDAEKYAVEKQVVPLELVPPECVPSSLDTTAVDAGGNWVVKRAFWGLAEKLYEKIMKINDDLYDRQIEYIKARAEIDRKTDDEFRELGFEQGQLQELLSKLVADVTLQREQRGTLDEPERDFLKRLNDKVRDLEQMQLDLKALDELETSLDNVMNSVVNQIASCRKYEKQSWEHFKEISKELNDKKARLLYYEMEGFLKTVEQNQEYIDRDLWQYFNDTVKQLQDKIDQLKQSVTALSTKGTDLSKEYETFMRPTKEHEEVERPLDDEQARDEKEGAESKKTEKGIFARIRSWFGGLYTSITSGIQHSWHWFMSMFGGKVEPSQIPSEDGGVAESDHTPEAS